MREEHVAELKFFVGRVERRDAQDPWRKMHNARTGAESGMNGEIQKERERDSENDEQDWTENCPWGWFPRPKKRNGLGRCREIALAQKQITPGNSAAGQSQTHEDRAGQSHSPIDEKA